MTDDQLAARIAKLEQQIADQPVGLWGAAVAAMGEELRALQRERAFRERKAAADVGPIEAAARAMCVAEGVDPDLICWGVTERGKAIGETYPAWRYRAPLLKAAIAAYLRAAAKEHAKAERCLSAYAATKEADRLDQDPG